MGDRRRQTSRANPHHLHKVLYVQVALCDAMDNWCHGYDQNAQCIDNPMCVKYKFGFTPCFPAVEAQT